ncbi:transcriptional regulator GutM [Clostridium aminobutyricum]|uniref:Uncharacterized protein n=1 Tax=Clostridium aminobutyricum TaxID=33953 RepID=A0A939D8U5_CLOAM|nr:transcriptional regulator GutM [Clostridium aminobutyricum]MBN7773197.1 hypothetical protein [Clostridium aminobutyricum]
MFWNIVIITGFLWTIMSIFNFIQSVHIKNIFTMLQPSGKIYSGRDAGFLRTRYIAFAAVNPDGTVLNARLLKASGIVTLSKIHSLDYLISENLLALDPTSMNLDGRSTLAIQNLITNFKKYSNHTNNK